MGAFITSRVFCRWLASTGCSPAQRKSTNSLIPPPCSPAATDRSAPRPPRSVPRRKQARPPKTSSVVFSRQFGKELVEFLLGPCSRRACANIAEGAGHHRECGDVVAARRFNNGKQIVRAGREIELLDLDPELLGEVLGGLAPLGSILDGSDSLLGPVHGQDECRHLILPYSPDY